MTLLVPALLALLSTPVAARTWNVPGDGALGVVVFSLADGDVLELEPGCCGGGFFPIPTINARVTVQSAVPGVLAAAPAMRFTAPESGGVGVVIRELSITANGNSCTGSTVCTMEVAPGVLVELFDVDLTSGSAHGIWAQGAAGSPATVRIDGFDASGPTPVVDGSFAEVVLRNGTITGSQAVGIDSGSATLSDLQVVGCTSAAGGGLLELQGSGQATLTRVDVDGCTAATGAALIEASGFDIAIDRLDARDTDGAGPAALIHVQGGSLSWVHGEVCGAQGPGTSTVRVEGGSLQVTNLAVRGGTGLGSVFEQASPTADGLLAQLTLDLEGAGAAAVASGGAVELFNNQLLLDGAALGDATLVGRSGHNQAIGAFPPDWTPLAGDFADADAGWAAAYESQRGDCTAIGVPRVSESHPAWDGGYTDSEWTDPDCTPSDVGVFGGPFVDLALATWFDLDLECVGGDPADPPGVGGLAFAGGLASCGCGGGTPAGWWLLLLPWIRRRRSG